MLESTITRKGAISSSVVGNPLINSPELSTFCRKIDCFEVRVSPVSLIVGSLCKAMPMNL